jgi:hypothetical protein
MADSKKKIVGEVRLKNVRLSFAHLFEPQPGKVDERTGVKGEDRWNASFLIDKNTPEGKAELKKVQAAAAEAKTAKWGAPQNWPKLKPDRLCLRDGDLENYDGYDGHYYLAAGRNVKTKDGAENPPPVLVDRDPSVALDRKSGKLYSGCYVNAVVRIWAQDDKKYGKRLNASLEAVQFLRHGDAFGARPVDPMEAFQDETTEEEVGEYMDGQEAAEEEDDLIG